MTKSAPSKMGFCKIGEAKVLSQTNVAWFALAILEISSTSVTFS